jgi:hypothetical protein
LIADVRVSSVSQVSYVFVVHLDKHVEGHPIRASKRIDLQYLVSEMEVESHDEVGNAHDWPPVDGEDDVVYLQTCRLLRRPSNSDVGNDCSPASPQAQAGRERRDL